MAGSASLTGPYPWQTDPWARLRAALETGRVPHATLVHGPEGLGKRHLARLFAAALLCDEPDAQRHACGACRSCTLLASGSHPDFHRCVTEAEAEDDPATGIIGVDEVRAVSAFLSLTAHRKGRKVAFIREAHRMNVNAANALLKTLEEPPGDGVLILTTAHPSRLPATVLSRCQKLRCAPPDLKTAQQWLEAEMGPRAEAARLLALAGGSPLAAARLGEETLARHAAMPGELSRLAGGRGDPLDLAGEWLKFGARESLYLMYHWLVDLRRVQAGGATAGVTDDAKVRALAQRIAPRHLHRLAEHTAHALRLLEGQSNPQLLVEEALIRWTVALAGAPGGGQAP